MSRSDADNAAALGGRQISLDISTRLQQLADVASHLVRILLYVAFPSRDDQPAHILKPLFCSTVPRHIRVKLRLPEFPPAFRDRRVGAARMPMPKAPMHKQNRPIPREDQIRPAGEVVAVNPEPVSQTVEVRPDSAFRTCVLSTYPAHQSASGWLGHDIHRSQAISFRLTLLRRSPQSGAPDRAARRFQLGGTGKS